MTLSGHSALLTNVVAGDAAGEAGFRLPRLPRRRIDTASGPVHLPARFFFFSATTGKPIPCDAHHCARGRVGLESNPTSTRIGDGNHVAADSASHDRRCDGVDRDRVGVRGGRIGGRVNPPVRLHGRASSWGRGGAKPAPTAVRRWERGAVSGYVFRFGRSAAYRGGQKRGFLVWFHQPARASG